jgi:hypothetical protein
VRIGASGQKTFVLVGRDPGRRNPTRRAIGAYPTISLEQARATARDWLALIPRGIDPAVQVAAEREANRVRQSNTFGPNAELFLTKHAASKRTAGAIGRLVKGKLIARWRDRPFDTLGKRDIINMIEEIRDNNGIEIARQTYTYSRLLFSMGCGTGSDRRESLPPDPYRRFPAAES